MTSDPDEAALYDAVHTGTPGDVDFYVRLAEGAASVLELGCGSGRVLVALASAGVRASGVELERGMLDAARARAAGAGVEVELIEADMARFDLGARFDRVVAPFASLYCLLTPERLASCLRSVRAHLAPGGLFAFDAYAADDFHDHMRPEDYPDDRLEPVADIAHGGEALHVLERSRWDRDAQRVDATYVYLTESGAVRHEQTIGHRYLRRPEIEPLLAQAGLALVSLHGDFEGGPYDPSNGSLVVIARAARRRA